MVESEWAEGRKLWKRVGFLPNDEVVMNGLPMGSTGLCNDSKKQHYNLVDSPKGRYVE